MASLAAGVSVSTEMKVKSSGRAFSLFSMLVCIPENLTPAEKALLLSEFRSILDGSSSSQVKKGSEKTNSVRGDDVLGRKKEVGVVVKDGAAEGKRTVRSGMEADGKWKGNEKEVGVGTVITGGKGKEAAVRKRVSTVVGKKAATAVEKKAAPAVGTTMDAEKKRGRAFIGPSSSSSSSSGSNRQLKKKALLLRRIALSRSRSDSDAGCSSSVSKPRKNGGNDDDDGDDSPAVLGRNYRPRAI